VKRHKEGVALLEETASAVADPGFRARALLKASDIARHKLQKRGKARELVERALEVAPRDKAALVAWTDLLVEIGDGDSAVRALERLFAEENDAAARARLLVRIGRLLEELLLKPDEALARFKKAAELDATNKDAWAALKTIARQRGDRALLVDALRGQAVAEVEAKDKAALWMQIAKVERDERADAVAAEAAFVEALAHSPGDVESLTGLATLLAARLQPDVDVDAALAQPQEALLDALRAPILKAAAANPGLSLPLRRLEAMALSRLGERAAALARFELILSEKPDDLGTLMALARHLAAAPRGEPGAEQRRLRCLEAILLHHAYSLKPPIHVDVWGEVTALRAATGDHTGARKAAKKVMALVTAPTAGSSTEELKACLSDRAVRAVASSLDDARDTEREPKVIIQALQLDASRSIVDSERARLLERAAAIALEEMKDKLLARKLLEDALRECPSSQTAREALLDLDLAAGDMAGALRQVRELIAKETDPKKKAALHLRLFRLKKKHGQDLDGAAAELKAGLELDPGNAELMDAAESFFHERKDTDGLDKMWSAQLRLLDRSDVRARLKLLERLAQLRRYERRDLPAAVEALEAMTVLDPDALKPREDAARIYTELGMGREAVGAWRGVLERDPLVVEAWRGLFSRFVAMGLGDEAFAVGSTMLALDLAEDDVARLVRTLRPPFPRWPIPPKDPALFRRKAAHPLERTPIRAILDAVAPRVLPLYARGLKDFGIKRKDALADKNIPSSVLLAVRTLGQLLGLREGAPPLFVAELGSTDGQSPPFAALPSTEPGIIVTQDVLKGGMTPERAFALGRAASWLQPHAVMVGAVDGPTLRTILEGLVSAFLGNKSLERPDLEAERVGKELSHALLRGLSPSEDSALKAELMPALRDYVHARGQVQVADWRAGVGYTGDRVGFLMSSDLNASFRMIKATAGSGQSIGARLAIKELVLFSVSSSYLALRKDLGLALPESTAAPLLDLV
jgi:tetratricopeptide (TPR) repeat protein